jgi:hypothetical protein
MAQGKTRYLEFQKAILEVSHSFVSADTIYSLPNLSISMANLTPNLDLSNLSPQLRFYGSIHQSVI